MVKPEPASITAMVERAFGAGREGDDKVVVDTDFILELTPAEKQQLDHDRQEARQRLFAAG